MGSQQLLVLFLATLVTAVAVVAGFALLKSSGEQANRNAIMAELGQLIGTAREYYRKPVLLGGGGGNYRAFKMPALYKNSPNAKITRIKQGHAKSHIHFLATGNTAGKNGADPIQIEVLAYGHSIKLIHLN